MWAPNSGAPNPSPALGEATVETRDWYPGDAYVDWVGIDHYARQTATVAQAASAPEGLNAFYDEFCVRHGKPLMLAEWGVWDRATGGTGDDGTWISDMFSWMASHPRVKAQVYFNYQATDGNHRLEDFPKAAEAFRRAMAEPRWVRTPL